MPKKRETGFTLIELIIGLTILFILAAISFRLIHQIRERTKVVVAKSQLSALSIALEMVKNDTGYYPPEEDDLSLSNLLLPKSSPPSGLENGWDGSYISSLPVDPWGMPYFYVVQEGPVFGPIPVFRLKAGPCDETFTFSATPYPKAKLVMENICKIVHAGEIWLNGEEVISQNEFRNDLSKIEKEVALFSENTLRIKLWSKPGSYIFLTIFSFTSQQTNYIIGSYGADKEGGGLGFDGDIIWVGGQFSQF